MANEQGQNGRGKYQIYKITCVKGVTLNDYICVQGRGVLRNWS